MKFKLAAIIAPFLAAAIYLAPVGPVNAADPSPPPPPPSPAAMEPAPLIAAFGDSLSSGYNLPREDGFAPALRRQLQKISVSAEVQNHGIAGDTTDDALTRVDWMLQEKPDIVVLEFGANDMFQARPPAHIRANLDRLMTKIRGAGAVVVLAGMMAPLNSGAEYAKSFNAIYPELAKKHGVELYPFFLRDVALVPELNLPDGLHPNADGVDVIAANIAPVVARAVRRWRESAQ